MTAEDNVITFPFSGSSGKTGGGAGDNGGGPPMPPSDMEIRLVKLEAAAEKAGEQLLSIKSDLAAIKNDQASKKDLGDLRLDFAKLDGRLTESIAKLDGRLSENFAKLEGRLSNDFSKLEGRLGSDFAKLEGRLSSDMNRLDATLKGWMLATVLTVIGSVIGLGLFMMNALKQAPTPPAQSQQPTVIVLPSAATPAPAQPTAPATSR